MESESGYFRAKIAQEQLIRDSSIPYSIVHATQFFEFIKSIAAAPTDGDTVRVAPVLIQPIAADDVARAVGQVAVGSPVNGIVEVAGPEQLRLDELSRRGLSAERSARGDHRPGRALLRRRAERSYARAGGRRAARRDAIRGLAAPARDPVRRWSCILLLIAGLATPLVGAALAVDMFVALVTAHIAEGFFAADGGIELVLLLGGASLAVVLTGAGRFSAADAALDLPQQLRAAGSLD
jgi:hypothetical protein